MFLHSPSMVRTTRCHWKTCLLECLSQPINSSETWWQIISTLETLHLNMMCVCVVVVDGLLSKILSGTYLQLQALVSGIRFHQIPKLCLMILAYWVCPVSPIWDATPSKYTKKNMVFITSVPWKYIDTYWYGDVGGIHLPVSKDKATWRIIWSRQRDWNLSPCIVSIRFWDSHFWGVPLPSGKLT
jgi:hypothetical protein